MTTNISFIRDQKFVNGFSPVAGASQEFIDLLQKIVQHAGTLLAVQQCSLALLDTSSMELVTLAALPEEGEKLHRTRLCLNEGIAGRTAARREALIVNDARCELPDYPGMEAVLCVPLIEQGRFIGTLSAASTQANAFDEQKVALLEFFAEQAIVVMSGMRAAEQSLRKTDQLEQLIHLSRDITAHLEPGVLYDSMLSDARSLIPCNQARIYLYDENEQGLYPVAEWFSAGASGNDEGRACNAGVRSVGACQERIRLTDARSVIAWAALHRHPILRAPRKQAGCAHAEASMAEMAAPLLSKQRLYGVLVLKRVQPFNSEELRLMRHLSSIAATALENVALFQQIHTEQEQLRAILESCSDGIALLDANACVVEVNPAFARLFNSDPAQMVGKACMELFASPEEGEAQESQELAPLRDALEQRQPLSYREIELLIQGTIRSMGVSITPVDTVGDQALSLLVARDVTEIRDANRTRARFLSMVTHELRSPLNAINGYLDLALAGVGGELSESLREFLQRARASSEHLYALLEDLFLIARADAGQLRLNRAIVTLPDIIANAVEEQELTATDQGISITVDIAKDFPRLYADAGRLQQVLRNLLNNALRFTPAGGQVAICARVETEGHDAELDEDVRVLKLQVGDTGIGIAPEHWEQIFERFYQVPGESGGRSGGQGLGLAIVKMIVELHGGHVSVESVPGQGSTFTCTLPCLLA